ncbi:unnamed protein product [Ceutorhynchus assimilis]|uniref:Migration and invasion enhancer 1 n=1 Tax=Ceutorhynchus assimilis TaxID=467358 RepID=A0A9N9QMM3_9CUCU|nr:unnamed protein product [Ceutorhynchus assimilis]
MNNVTVDVEYCNKCNPDFFKKFQELEKQIKNLHPNVNVHGQVGRRGSFEVQINGSVVHSKLRTMAYPDCDDLEKLVQEAEEGKLVERQCKQEPISSCSIS